MNLFGIVEKSLKEQSRARDRSGHSLQAHVVRGVPMMGFLNGTTWFKLSDTSSNTCCLPVPVSDPNFKYYYAILIAAVATGKAVYVANQFFLA